MEHIEVAVRKTTTISGRSVGRSVGVWANRGYREHEERDRIADRETVTFREIHSATFR